MYEVTLSIAVYNAEKYIERALLSALNQTFESIELLIINDKSTDGSIEIVRDIASKHPRGEAVRIISHTENGGLAAVRNTAIREANGKYLFFMDSDDTVTPTCIEILYKQIETSKVDFVASSYRKIFPDGKTRDIRYGKEMLISDKKQFLNFVLDGQGLFITTWNKLYDLSFLRDNNIGCIQGHQIEDIWFTFLIRMKAHSCIILRNITYNYYVNNNSSSDYKQYAAAKKTRIVWQYLDTDRLKKDYLINACKKNSRDYIPLACWIMKGSIRYAYIIMGIETLSDSCMGKIRCLCCSPQISHQVVQVLSFPDPDLFTGLFTSRHIRKKLFIYLMCKSPYFIKVPAIIIYCKLFAPAYQH